MQLHTAAAAYRRGCHVLTSIQTCHDAACGGALWKFAATMAPTDQRRAVQVHRAEDAWVQEGDHSPRHTVWPPTAVGSQGRPHISYGQDGSGGNIPGASQVTWDEITGTFVNIKKKGPSGSRPTFRRQERTLWSLHLASIKG